MFMIYETMKKELAEKDQRVLVIVSYTSKNKQKGQRRATLFYTQGYTLTQFFFDHGEVSIHGTMNNNDKCSILSQDPANSVHYMYLANEVEVTRSIPLWSLYFPNCHHTKSFREFRLEIYRHSVQFGILIRPVPCHQKEVSL